MKLVYSMQEIAAQKKRDEEERKQLWEQLEREAGGGEKGKRVADAMRTYYSMFDEKLVDWSAHLYDKGHGAYYTCSIGRDTEGYLPDVESTNQLIRVITGNGALSLEDLPEDMKARILSFVKSCQSSDDGYF